MNQYYTLKVPNPCHEDWSTMTPKDKGRFCSSCSKTVIDFTKMDSEEIQSYLFNNRDQNICGHFRQSQLDTINLKVPYIVFNQHLSFHRLFLLALLFSMGITLFSCKDNTGKTKKIETVEIVENHKQKNDSIINNDTELKPGLDSTKTSTPNVPITEIHEEQLMDDLMIVETMGDLELVSEIVDHSDSKEIEPHLIEDIPYCTTTDLDNIVLGFVISENGPEFKDTPKNLSKKEKNNYFSEKLNSFVKNNFNTEACLELKGVQKIQSQFTINEKGLVENIKVRAPHPALEKEITRVLNLLPPLLPAMQKDQPISITYNLPVKFKVED